MLACPRCAAPHPDEERFCRDCGMPLVHAGMRGVEQTVSEPHERARKIKPQYAEGDLVRVAGGRNQAEAEFIQGLLLEEGVPSLVWRSRGFDVPDMLAAGPRDVLVPASGAPIARQALLDAEMIGEALPGAAVAHPLRLLAVILAVVALLALVAWLGTSVLS